MRICWCEWIFTLEYSCIYYQFSYFQLHCVRIKTVPLDIVNNCVKLMPALTNLMHSILQQFLKKYANFCPMLCNTSAKLNNLFYLFVKFLNEHTIGVIGTSSLLQNKQT